MKKVITINSDMPLDKAYKFFSKHKLLALPIVDDEGKFLGIIDIEEYIEKLTLLTDEKYCLDVFQIMGISIDKKVKSPFKNYIARMPWILCNMVGGIICAIISRMHEIVISKILILALFIPLVLALSESISMQAMTYSLQQIKNSTHQYLKSNILKESKTIMLMALTSGILVGIISIFWNYGVSASACISISIIISIFISALFGMAFPIILHRLNLDPKVAAGPVVLAFADVLTTSIYLGLASILFL